MNNRMYHRFDLRHTCPGNSRRIEPHWIDRDFVSSFNVFVASGVAFIASAGRWVLNRRVVAFAFWIVAALCATMMTLGSTAAFAHPGHHRLAHSMAGAAAETTTEVATRNWAIQSNVKTQPAPGATIHYLQAVAVFFDGVCPRHRACGCAPGLDCGCCASPCVIAANHALPWPNGGGSRLHVAPPLAFADVDPNSLLDPPILRS